MRYSQYKTINELSESLNEALIYISKTKNYALLEDCLMAMTAISETLLNEPGRGAEKAKIILADMYNILEVLDNPEEDIPKLAEISSNLANECKANLKYKLRILFVAELGSKWDSMGSVYKAFLERDDCDIDVVLEPIFRATQLPNGETKAEIIYDDWLTPLGINHIPYKQYDMETIQPDITFISQPYESVTIPMFWPENIAKYSKLVYLPYYTAHQMVPGSTPFVSFMTMPVQYYSWRIVAQSGAMKEAYAKFASNKGENVIVTGLPKWDHVISLKDSHPVCPVEWEVKLKGKKVFLLNTHFVSDFTKVFALNTDNALASVLSVLKDRDDFAVIWRPHPMTETVAKIYNPRSYECFEKCKEIFRASSNLIVDETETYDMAFAFSDCLITWKSSLLSQYLLSGKEILLYVPQGKSNCTNEELFETNELFDYSVFEYVRNRSEFIEYINDYDNVENRKGNKINELISKYFYFPDGKAGLRVCETIVSDFERCFD